MSSDEIEIVESFLAEARGLVGAGRFVLVPREKNLQGLADLGVTPDQAWEIVIGLTPNNYCKGPEEDRDRDGWLWFFGVSVERRLAYVKLKIDEGRNGRLLKCVSFHPAEETLRFPLRPRRPNQR